MEAVFHSPFAINRSPLTILLLLPMTEIDFTLPNGVLDQFGRIHRHGRMRMATVLDEVEPTIDPRAVQNPAYLSILLLARVITRLGELVVSAELVQSLYAADMAYLEDLYLRLNAHQAHHLHVACPTCQQQLEVQVAPMGTI